MGGQVTGYGAVGCCRRHGCSGDTLERSEMESSSSGLPKNPRAADCCWRLPRSEMEFSSSGLLKNRRAADCCCRLQRSEMESSSLRIAEESSSSRLLLPSATFWNGILLFPDCLRILDQPIVVAVCNVLPWNPPLLDCGRILEQQREEELDDFMQGVCLSLQLLELGRRQNSRELCSVGRRK